MRRPGLLATILVLLVSCTSSSGPPVSPSESPLTAWKDCGSGFQCAVLSVPMDHTRPDDRKIALSLIRLPASDSQHRMGSVLLDPGGPGASGIDYLRQNWASLAGLHARFDVVAFDPRGVGRSSPVRCLPPGSLDAYFAADPILDDPAERALYADLSRRFSEGCADRSGGILPFIGTRDVARDMDLIRAFLGDDRLTYFGLSYGTRLGATYADLYPNRVRAMALDGGVDPSQDLLLAVRDQAIGFEEELQAFLSHCRMQPCALGIRGDPGRELDRTLRRLDETPLQIGDRSLGRGSALLALAGGLYDRRTWSLLDLALSEAAGGNGARLLSLADASVGRYPDGTYSNIIEAYNAVICEDGPAPGELSAYESLVARTKGRAQHFGETVIYGALPCATWLLPPVDSPAAVSPDGIPAVLIIAGRHDPATPYVWSVALQAQLPGSVLLTRRGHGHGSYSQSACVRAAVDDYLISGALPPPRTVCA